MVLDAQSRRTIRWLLLFSVAAASLGSSNSGEARYRPDAPAKPLTGISPRLVVQLGHLKSVNSVAISSDGRLVLTGSDDKTAKLWDAETGKELRSFVGHLNVIRSVAFSPDRRRILTGSDDKTAKLWDAETGEEIRAFTGHSEWVSSVAFSPDGRRVLTGSYDNTAKLWNAETGKEIRSFAHSKFVWSVAFSPDGRRVLTGSDDKTAKLWEVETGKEIRSFTGHLNSVTSVAFSPDGRRLLTGSDDDTAKLWEVETGKEIRSFTGHSQSVSTVAFSPDGRRVLTGSFDDTAKLWNVETGKEIRSFLSYGLSVNGVAFSPDGRRVLTGTFDNTARMWDAETGKELCSFTGYYDRALRSVAFSPDGRHVLVGLDNSARMWDAETGKELRSFSHRQSVVSSAFSPDGRRVLTGSEDDTARIWDAETGKELRSFAHPSAVLSVAFSPDGRQILTGSRDKSARLWDAGTGKELRSFSHRQSVVSVAFSPDGRRVLTGAEGENAKLWDAESGKELRSLPHSNTMFSVVAFSPNGRRILTGGADAMLILWDSETGKYLRSFVGDSWVPTSVAFSRDGRRVLTGDINNSAELWNVETGEEIRSFTGQNEPIRSVAFSPDGRRVLTGGDDTTARLWDVETGNCMATLVSFHDGTWAVVDPAGRFDGSNDGKVEGLHWVVGDTPIALSQLSERYYEPGLLAKLLGFDKEPLRRVERFEDPKLFPEVKLAPLAPGATTLKIDLKNQGGGIGRVQVLVNGKELSPDARGPGIDPNAAKVSLMVDLVGAAAVKPGQTNQVEVIAWNTAGHIASRGVEMVWRAPGLKEVEPPEIFAIVSGIARYGSPSMNLMFAGKDAVDMATAIRVSSKRLFGARRVHLMLLTDYPGAKGAQIPSRENLAMAFNAARKAKHDDILVVYLAGHGTVAPDGEYWYLTREARSTDLSDPEVRKMSGVSSKDLTDWIKAVPVTKQVMILDTCAAGAAVVKLSEERALSSDQVRAIARLKDRTGLYVLMGSAADAASYEASQYGQGLLTYALLEGMRGAALRDGEYVDVAQLFAHATEEVPKLARSIGGIQSPIISAPRGASFDIGQLTSDDRRLVPLAMVRPMILRASFQGEVPPYDDGLDLSRRVDVALRAAADPSARGGKIVYVDGDELPGALRLTGRYITVGATVRVDSYMLEGKSVRAHFEVSGSMSDLDGLARTLVEKAQDAAPDKR